MLLTDATARRTRKQSRELRRARNLDAEFGRTTDPVRMYMPRDGHRGVADPRGRNSHCERIEEGLEAVKIALGSHPALDLLLRHYQTVKRVRCAWSDVIVGFVDPNAPDEIASPKIRK